MCKEYGGLGILSLRDLNICLLASWLKRYNEDKGKLWKELIDFKYNTEKPNILAAKSNHASSFFKGFMLAIKAAKVGYKWKIGNGQKIRLWEDHWCGNSSLAIQFWPLYRILNEYGKTIAEIWDGFTLKCIFRRNLNDHLYQMWLEVIELVSTIQISPVEDEMVWQFSSKGTFTTQSLYKIVNFRGISQVHIPAVWGLKIPPRVQMFLWLLMNNRTLTRDNLAKRQKLKDETCLFCEEKETCQHLFFDCAVARRLWQVVSDITGIATVTDLECIGRFWLSNKQNSLLNLVTSAVIWSL